MIKALIELCSRTVGGVHAVAAKTGLSEENLKQIIKGVVLKSTNNPRGVGPSVRKVLTQHYPDWLSRMQSVTIAQALETLVDALLEMSEADRTAIAPKLQALALAPDSKTLLRSVEVGLTPKPTLKATIDAAIAADRHSGPSDLDVNRNKKIAEKVKKGAIKHATRTGPRSNKS